MNTFGKNDSSQADAAFMEATRFSTAIINFTWTVARTATQTSILSSQMMIFTMSQTQNMTLFTKTTRTPFCVRNESLDLLRKRKWKLELISIAIPRTYITNDLNRKAVIRRPRLLLPTAVAATSFKATAFRKSSISSFAVNFSPTT